MELVFDERLANSSLVEMIWHTHSERAGTFISVAVSNWEMTEVSLVVVFVPFAAEKLAFNITFGALAVDILLLVLASSLLIKRLSRKVWRRMHYGAIRRSRPGALPWPVDTQ
jgi:hypothetical protein